MTTATAELQLFILAEIHKGSFKQAKIGMDTSKKRLVQDPFSQLSDHLIYAIISYLPVESLNALRVASYIALCSTNRDEFWKGHLHASMPWFWELRGILEGAGELITDHRAFYTWLNHETAILPGAPAPLLGLVNRRRIWEATQQLDSDYFRFRDFEAQKFVDEEIITSAKCLHQPGIMVEPTKDFDSDMDQNQHVFFAYSWDEIRTAPARFVAIFQKLVTHTRLVGFGICCGSSRRIWGIDPSQDDIEDGTYMVDGTIIPAGSWIARLVFTIHTEIHDEGLTSYPTSIEV